MMTAISRTHNDFIVGSWSVHRATQRWVGTVRLAATDRHTRTLQLPDTTADSAAAAASSTNRAETGAEPAAIPAPRAEAPQPGPVAGRGRDARTQSSVFRQEH